MSKKGNKTIFIDTNIFLHFKFFLDVDWAREAGAGQVLIVIPPITMKEVDTHKYVQKDPVFRKRAEKVASKLSKIILSEEKEEIRPSVKIFFDAREPDEEFSKHSLSRTSQDDHLLASICLYKNDHPDEEIILITNDMALKVKAKPLFIKTQGLPDEYRLELEADPNAKKIKDLEQQIRELTRRVPQPKILFGTGEDNLKFQVADETNQTPSIAEAMKDLKLKHPKMEFPPEPKPFKVDFDDPNPFAVDIDLIDFDSPSKSDIEKYNGELDSFYRQYEKYLARFETAKNLNARKLELKFQLANSGTAPAEDLVVFIEIPAHLVIVREKKDFEYPAKPTPPEKPKPRRYVGALDDIYNRKYSERLFIPGLHPSKYANQYIEPPNIERNGFSQDDNYHHISFRVRKAIQGLVYKCPYDIFLVFASLEEAESFKIEYKIIAANIPQRIEDSLHIIVKR